MKERKTVIKRVKKTCLNADEKFRNEGETEMKALIFGVGRLGFKERMTVKMASDVGCWCGRAERSVM